MNIRLPRLPNNWQSQPRLVERYWGEAMNSIEKAINALNSIPAIESALALVDAATVSAQTAANNANASIVQARQETSIITSYPSGVTLTCTAAGVVTISAHSRIYGDISLNPTVSVAGGALSTDQPATSVIRVYYDDPSFSGGTVAYLFTTDPDAPPTQGGVRHVVGTVLVPATGSNTGKVLRNPGFVDA
jgi:hypothetical protein